MIVLRLSDTLPSARLLLQSDGTPIDLTGCTITLRLRSRTGVVTSVPCSIVSPATGGLVEIDRTALPAVGDYDGWARVVPSVGQQRTIPNKGSERVVIEAAP